MGTITLKKDDAMREYCSWEPYSMYDEEGNRLDAFYTVEGAVYRIQHLLREAEEEIEAHVEELAAARDEVLAYQKFLDTYKPRSLAPARR